MTRTLAAALALIGVLVAENAQAVPAGKSAEWDTPNGKVVFDGKIHSEQGLKCLDCHSKIFKMKKGSTEMKMADINGGKFCGECHNGTKAFTTNDAANCGRCHKK